MKEGWKYLKLVEVGKTQTGMTPTKSNSSFYGDFMPFIRPAELNIDGNGSIKYDSEIKLSEAGVAQSRLINENSVLMCCIGSIGKTAYTSRNITCNQQINAITPYKEHNPRFIYYALISPQFQEQVIKIANSARATLAIISKGKWENVSIPVPPLPEQQRIVEYLDTQFAKIDALKANAAQQLQAAKDLFQSALKDLMTPKDGWEEKRINELGETKIGPFGSLLHKSDYIKNGIPLINPMHIKNSEIVADYNYSITKTKAEELNNYSLKTNDIIIGRRGEMGRCAVVDNNSNGWICGTGCLFFRPKTNVVNSKFLQLCISSDTYIAQLEHLAGGATMLNLNSKALSQLEFRLPSLKEQQEIIGVISQISSVISKLQSNYEQTITLCSDLKQSLLKQIFE